MIKVNVSFRDMDGFDAQLDEISDAINAKLEDIATLVRDEAKATSEFADKTGKLRGSIRKRKSRFEGGGYIVEAKAPHAHLVELGHVLIAWGHITGKRVPPHPFMRPALDKGMREAVNLFRSNK